MPKLEQYEEFAVPPVPDIQEMLNEDSDQTDFCQKANCQDEEEVDCGNCLFSESHCSRGIFVNWKLQKKQENE